MTTTQEVAPPTAPTLPHWIAFLRERRARLSDPADIAKVDIFIEHLTAELEHDLPRTMATMHPEGKSRHWGGGDFLAAMGPEMTNQVRPDFYAQLLALGSENVLCYIALETERFWVGEDGLAMDGVLWVTATGRELAVWGGGELPEGSTEDDTFEIGRRMAMFMSIRDGRIVGEDGYADQDVVVRRVSGFPPVERTRSTSS